MALYYNSQGVMATITVPERVAIVHPTPLTSILEYTPRPGDGSISYVFSGTSTLIDLPPQRTVAFTTRSGAVNFMRRTSIMWLVVGSVVLQSLM